MSRKKKHHSPSLSEFHVRILCNGVAIQLEGVPASHGTPALHSLYKSGLFMIYHLLECMIPQMDCISVSGTWHPGASLPFRAFDIWVEGDGEGFYLRMDTAAALFADNGIPYYHKPPMD